MRLREFHISHIFLHTKKKNDRERDKKLVGVSLERGSTTQHDDLFFQKDDRQYIIRIMML